MSKILLIGPVAPPFGGVSVHLARLSRVLSDGGCFLDFVDESKNVKANFFNIRTFNLFVYFLKILNSDVVHIHSGHYVLRLFHSFCCVLFRKKFIVTLHSFRGSNRRLLGFQRFILNKASSVICVNEEILNQVNVDNSLLLPAFIPPDLEREEELPDDVVCWINEKKSNGFYLASSNAYSLQCYEGEDLYGLDLLIEAVSLANDNGLKLCLFFNVSNSNDGFFSIEDYEDKIRKRNLSNLIKVGKYSDFSFVRLILESDVTVRATNTDGDALSVRESLYFGVPVIASDVVERPQGSILFRNRDFVSLFERLCGLEGKDDCSYFGESMDYFKIYEHIYLK